MPRAPDFWRAPPGWTARLLSPLGWLYGAATARRMRRAGASVEAPVICVGNFTLGGAGKTPAVIALAAMLRGMGANPVVVSRGYGGSSAGPLRVDPATHDAALVGDEPLEIAAHAAVIVARDRVAGARAAIAAGADCVLLDDGMQNPSLEKNLTFAVIDGGALFGNGFCAPSGPLRAPVAAQAGHVDALILIGAASPPDGFGLSGKPFFAARLSPDADVMRALREANGVLAFAGIGRPEKFFDMLRDAGVSVAATKAFGDHQPYRDADLAAIAAAAAEKNLVPVTTMKDLSRIGATRAEAMFAGRLRPVPAPLVFDDADGVRALMARALRGRKRAKKPEA